MAGIACTENLELDGYLYDLGARYPRSTPKTICVCQCSNSRFDLKLKALLYSSYCVAESSLSRLLVIRCFGCMSS